MYLICSGSIDIGKIQGMDIISRIFVVTERDRSAVIYDFARSIGYVKVHGFLRIADENRRLFHPGNVTYLVNKDGRPFECGLFMVIVLI